MKKFIGLLGLSVLLFMVTGCATSAPTTTKNDENVVKSSAKQTPDAKSTKELAIDYKSALEKVFGGEANLSDSGKDVFGMKGSLSMTFDVSRNATKADVQSLANVFADLGYKEQETSEDLEDGLGGGSNLSLSGSPYYLSIDIYYTRKQVGIMLFPSDLGEQFLNYEEE